MNDVEEKLRRAMRPIDPPEGFAERVMRALPARERPAAVVVLATVPRAPRTSAWRRFSTPVTLAASLVVAVLVGKQIAIQHEEREGLAASQELMQALRVTSQKLDLAYQAVNSPPRSPEPAEAEEENRS
jgi:negative regulator of sigma E activity